MVEVPVEFTGGAVVLGMGVPPKPDFGIHQGTPQTPRIHIAFRAEAARWSITTGHSAVPATGRPEH